MLASEAKRQQSHQRDRMAAQQLSEMLSITMRAAEDLLRETGGEIEAAVSLHFANPMGRNRQPQSPR